VRPAYQNKPNHHRPQSGDGENTEKASTITILEQVPLGGGESGVMETTSRVGSPAPLRCQYDGMGGGKTTNQKIQDFLGGPKKERIEKGSQSSSRSYPKWLGTLGGSEMGSLNQERGGEVTRTHGGITYASTHEIIKKNYESLPGGEQKCNRSAL